MTTEHPVDASPASGRESATLRFAIGRLAGNDSTVGWPEIDASLLEDGRAAVPPFPVDLLPQPWRDWVSDTARSTGAPADYVAQAVLAAVAGLCGAGVAVRISPVWVEPMVLWQALVGGPSSGKSPALAPVRRLLAAIEEEFRAGDDAERPARMVVADTAIEAVAAVVSANPRGVILWRDEPSCWLADLDHRWLDAWAAGGVALDRATRNAPLQLERCPVSILGTFRPDRLEETLRDGNDDVAARFLYSWPARPPYCPLGDRGTASHDEALKMLRRIVRKARTPDDPLVVPFDQHGAKAFDGFLAGLHAELRHAEGLEAGWLGKGAGTVARLAGALELLAWSGSGATGLPGHIGRDQVEAAARLWTDYFRPHARAVLDLAAPTDLQCQARRVVRWLRAGDRMEATREDIRRHALCRTVNASRTDLVLGRLYAAGIVRPAPHEISPQGGRPAQRWQVNPAVASV
jgi:hypothetical protein